MSLCPGYIPIKDFRLTLVVRRATISFLAYSTATCVWAAATLYPLLGEDDEEEEEEEEDFPDSILKEGEDEDEDDSIFIPLARPRHIRGEHYVESDPEWQTFMRYSSDRKLLRSLVGTITSSLH